MRTLQISAYELAQRFVGIKEVPGTVANPQILAMLRLDNDWPEDDGVPWCAAFVNYIAWLLRLPRSKNLLARSWLTIGVPLLVGEAEPGFDIVVLKREDDGPEADVIDAPGHVGFFAGWDGYTNVYILGGNQGNTVSVQEFPLSRILGLRRLI